MDSRQRHRLKTVGKKITPLVRLDEKKLAQAKKEHKFLENCSAIYSNSRVEVQLFPCKSDIGATMQCNVRRHGDIDELTWRELQRIKTELFGEQAVAVEVFPAAEQEWKPTVEVRVLWILPTTWTIPFGLHLSTAWGCDQ